MRKFANRYGRLGTETAFAVGADAAAWSAKGNKVYPFHLGDMNITTPEYIRDAATKAARDGKQAMLPVLALCHYAKPWLKILVWRAGLITRQRIFQFNPVVNQLLVNFWVYSWKKVQKPYIPIPVIEFMNLRLNTSGAKPCHMAM